MKEESIREDDASNTKTDSRIPFIRLKAPIHHKLTLPYFIGVINHSCTVIIRLYTRWLRNLDSDSLGGCIWIWVDLPPPLANDLLIPLRVRVT